jgi:hypothetical protein
MSEQERQLRELEEEIPLLAGPAFAAAYQNALKSGMVFVQAIGNDLYEIHPDGSKKFIKSVEPAAIFPADTKAKIK